MCCVMCCGGDCGDCCGAIVEPSLLHALFPREKGEIKAGLCRFCSDKGLNLINLVDHFLFGLFGMAREKKRRKKDVVDDGTVVVIEQRQMQDEGEISSKKVKKRKSKHDLNGSKSKKSNKSKSDTDTDTTRKSKKARKTGRPGTSETSETSEESDNLNNSEDTEEETAPAPVTTTSSTVHLSTLQSIFSTRDSPEPTFTLFVPDPSSAIHVPSASASPRPSIPIPQVIPSPRPAAKSKLFFPHYDNPELHARSQFADPDESFFHHRTAYIGKWALY
jgi:hypothetical protein